MSNNGHVSARLNISPSVMYLVSACHKENIGKNLANIAMWPSRAKRNSG